MRILIVSNLYPPFYIGGYELNCSNVTKELIRRGHLVQVLTSPNHQPGPPDPNYITRDLQLYSNFTPNYSEGISGNHHLYLSDCSNFFNVSVMLNSIRTFKPDILFFWNIHGLGGLHLIDAANSLNMPWAIYLGDRVFEQITRPFSDQIRSIFRGLLPENFANGLIFSVSETLTNEIESLALFRFPNPPTHVYGYVNDLAPLPIAVRTYQEGGITRFIYAGRVGEHKGIKIICDSAKILLNNGHKRFFIDVYGEGDVDHFSYYARSLNINNYIKFHGGVSQSELSHIYLQSDAFLFPTWEREPFAFAPFEAAAYGCVPIITASCGPAERLVDGVHCIKCERNSSAFSNAMLSVINREIDLDTIGKLAANLVRQDLTFALHVDLIESGLTSHAKPTNSKSIYNEKLLMKHFLKHHLGLSILHNRVD